MSERFENLRPICSALLVADFKPIDRLKAILQIAYEILGASSIVAYKYNRASEHLDIFAMPGVRQREVMRGPTTAPVFAWEDAALDCKLEGAWLENGDEYRQYEARLPPSGPVLRQKDERESFRAREIEKHNGRGELALAKLCLYKGIGQTFDKVGQIFFNFHKEDAGQTAFDEGLKSAIQYIGCLVRELLIEELYHSDISDVRSGNDSTGTLRLLHAIDEKLQTARGAVTGHIGHLSDELHKQLLDEIEYRVSLLEHQVRVDGPVARIQSAKLRLQTMTELRELLSERSTATEVPLPDKNTPSYADALQELKNLIHEVLSRELWRMVCRTALSAVETYGGQADIILVLGGNLVRRVDPSSSLLDDRRSVLWLGADTISSYCIDKGKVFLCNNVATKASEPFKARFEREPAVGQHKSLMVVPVMIEGEVRALLRLMSTDEDCFLDKHAVAMQDIAFVVSYAMSFLDSAQRRETVAEGLSFFAEGQAVADSPSLPELLRSALRVLGASFAVFWPVNRSTEDERPFDKGLVVEVNDRLAPTVIDVSDPNNGLRPDGLTSYIYSGSQAATGDQIYCLHVLSELDRADASMAEYALQLFADQPIDGIDGAQEMSDAFLKSDFSSNDNLPHVNRRIPLSPTTLKQLHSQIGFAIKDRTTGVRRGVVWFVCERLHHLGWWERLYIQGLCNYLAQALKASNLQLAIRGFRHMIPNVATKAMLALEEATEKHDEAVEVENLGPPVGIEAATSMASDVLYMTMIKAWELKSLLNRPNAPSAFAKSTLRQILQRASGLASNLTIQTSDFVEGEIDTLGNFAICYGDGVDPGMHVNECLYTVAANILQNAVRHGKPPYVVWVFTHDDILVVVFGNGGDSPSPDPLCSFGTEVDSVEAEHGVGLAVVQRVLENEDGCVRLRKGDCDYDSAKKSPEHLRKCKTFFEVQIPIPEGG